MDIKIIYEDEDLLVIDKPTGVTVNRSDTTKDEETVQDWTEKKIFSRGPVNRFHPASARSSLSGSNELRAVGSPATIATPPDLEFVNRGGIVHRLDKETSGILLVAKNPAAFVNLQNQFKERKVEKVYLALAHGEVKPKEGEINVPVGRLSFNRKRFGVVAGGREAVTKYRVLSIKYYDSNGKKEPLSLLELYPKTGRTHQIRVHLKYFGHPVFSDPLYGGRKITRNDRKLLPRLFLHAFGISFFHPSFAKASAGEPKTGEKISFKSDLPKELQGFLESLKN